MTKPTEEVGFFIGWISNALRFNKTGNEIC